MNGWYPIDWEDQGFYKDTAKECPDIGTRVIAYIDEVRADGDVVLVVPMDAKDKFDSFTTYVPNWGTEAWQREFDFTPLVKATRPTAPELAEALYTRYCVSVGGKAFNGDPLPDWYAFNNDAAKQEQVSAWRDAATLALALL